MKLKLWYTMTNCNNQNFLKLSYIYKYISGFKQWSSFQKYKKKSQDFFPKTPPFSDFNSRLKIKSLRGFPIAKEMMAQMIHWKIVQVSSEWSKNLNMIFPILNLHTISVFVCEFSRLGVKNDNVSMKISWNWIFTLSLISTAHFS